MAAVEGIVSADDVAELGFSLRSARIRRYHEATPRGRSFDEYMRVYRAGPDRSGGQLPALFVNGLKTAHALVTPLRDRVCLMVNRDWHPNWVRAPEVAGEWFVSYRSGEGPDPSGEPYAILRFDRSVIVGVEPLQAWCPENPEDPERKASAGHRMDDTVEEGYRAGGPYSTPSDCGPGPADAAAEPDEAVGGCVVAGVCKEPLSGYQCSVLDGRWLGGQACPADQGQTVAAAELPRNDPPPPPSPPPPPELLPDPIETQNDALLVPDVASQPRAPGELWGTCQVRCASRATEIAATEITVNSTVTDCDRMRGRFSAGGRVEGEPKSCPGSPCDLAVGSWIWPAGQAAIQPDGTVTLQQLDGSTRTGSWACAPDGADTWMRLRWDDGTDERRRLRFDDPVQSLCPPDLWAPNRQAGALVQLDGRAPCAVRQAPDRVVLYRGESRAVVFRLGNLGDRAVTVDELAYEGLGDDLRRVVADTFPPDGILHPGMTLEVTLTLHATTDQRGEQIRSIVVRAADDELHRGGRVIPARVDVVIREKTATVRVDP